MRWHLHSCLQLASKCERALPFLGSHFDTGVCNTIARETDWFSRSRTAGDAWRGAQQDGASQRVQASAPVLL